MAKRRQFSRRRFRTLHRRRRFGARRLKKFIKRTFRRMSETKWSYLTLPTYANIDGFNGVITRINPLIAQGPDKSGRIGNKIKYKRLQFRSLVTILDGTSGVNPVVVTVRCLVVQPRINPAAGVALGPSRAEIFDSSTTNLACMTSSVNNTNVRVLMDKTYNRSSVMAGNYGGALPNFAIKLKVPITNTVNFAVSTDTLPTNPVDNYYFVILTNAGAINDIIVAYTWCNRISFIDI